VNVLEGRRKRTAMARKGISRRQFIGSSVAGVAVTGIKGLRPDGTEMGGSELAGEEPNSEFRITKSLNEGWRFKRQESPGE
jgi:hypothetical protein